MVYQSGFSRGIEPVEAGVDAAVTNLKSGGEAHRLGPQAGVDAVVLRKNFFSGKPQLLLLRSSADWTRPTTHIINGKPLKVN